MVLGETSTLLNQRLGLVGADLQLSLTVPDELCQSQSYFRATQQTPEKHNIYFASKNRKFYYLQP